MTRRPDPLRDGTRPRRPPPKVPSAVAQPRPRCSSLYAGGAVHLPTGNDRVQRLSQCYVLPRRRRLAPTRRQTSRRHPRPLARQLRRRRHCHRPLARPSLHRLRHTRHEPKIGSCRHQHSARNRHVGSSTRAPHPLWTPNHTRRRHRYSTCPRPFPRSGIDVGSPSGKIERLALTGLVSSQTLWIPLRWLLRWVTRPGRTWSGLMNVEFVKSRSLTRRCCQVLG